MSEGEDAATSYGGKDLKFKNNKTFDIMIEAHADDERVTVTVSKSSVS
ncbi:MAG: VanW family protein [Defluviitaleaceae bacterium]|nr:VanW family protein [Defluviitaleaceae bacterium]